MEKINVFWLRRDLRLFDNAGLYHALKSENPVLPVFIFDRHILDDLENKADLRVEFIHREISFLSEELKKMGSSLLVLEGNTEILWKQLILTYDIKSVYANEDYEPYAIARDQRINELLSQAGIRFQLFKDHLIFAKDEVVKLDGRPYTVFTPYSKSWKKRMFSELGSGDPKTIEHYPSSEHLHHLYQTPPFPIPGMKDLGFHKTGLTLPEFKLSFDFLTQYTKTQDFPGIDGTSRIGAGLRFGTISLREVVKAALQSSESFLNELIWREFYAMVLYHFPQVVYQSFRPEYDRIEWRNGESEFRAWCRGETGYPIVDAGMRQLNSTGYMHNRVRMVSASFLTKHLLIDWRWGEAYFASKLLDYELASNNGGWQWAAGCGTDAAPYFRIFNPQSQLEKFDRELKYVKMWVPEYGSTAYPKPIVDHKFARERCLNVYIKALRK